MSVAEDAEFLAEWLDFGLFHRGRAAMTAADAYRAAKTPEVQASLTLEAMHQYALAVDDVATWADACRLWERSGGPLSARLEEAEAGQSWEMLRSLKRGSPDRTRKAFGLPRFSAPQIADRKGYRDMMAEWAELAALVARIAGARTPDDSAWLVARLDNKVKHGVHARLVDTAVSVYGLQSQPVSLDSVRHFAKQTCLVSEFLGGLLQIFAVVRLGSTSKPKWYDPLVAADDPGDFDTLRTLVMEGR
ncbi:MAG: hypothetical protein WC273_12155 [Dehalococcoidia bacterium]